MLGMENLRHDLAWLCRNLERRTISLICNQPFHIWDCGYVMRVTHHCTLTALLPKRSQGKLRKSWLFNHFNKVFSVYNHLFAWWSLRTGDGNMCDPTMAPMQGIQAPSTLTSSKNREGEEDNWATQNGIKVSDAGFSCWQVPVLFIMILEIPI